MKPGDRVLVEAEIVLITETIYDGVLCTVRIFTSKGKGSWEIVNTSMNHVQEDR